MVLVHKVSPNNDIHLKKMTLDTTYERDSDKSIGRCPSAGSLPATVVGGDLMRGYDQKKADGNIFQEDYSRSSCCILTLEIRPLKKEFSMLESPTLLTKDDLL